MTIALTACGGNGFSSPEKKVIGNPEDGIMPLYLVDDEEQYEFLRRRAKELTPDQVKSKTFITLLARMLQTVNDPENRGVGIAAPQVGVSARFILVMRLDKEGDPFEIFVNPVIEKMSDETEDGEEGCLSIPGRRGMVKRARSIIISYLDTQTFRQTSEYVEGYTARIFQHEIDHLNGVLYTDKMEYEIFPGDDRQTEKSNDGNE